MNIKQKLEIRALVNLIISVLERLANIFDKFQKKDNPKIEPKKIPRVRPLKKVVDTIANIVPLPWRKK